MARQQTYVIDGKEFNVWTETQLSSINREALKKRCLDVRDHVGQDRLPPLPRQPEGMVAWMLEVQNMAQGVRQRAAYQVDEEEHQRPPADYPDDDDYDRQSAPMHDPRDRGPPGGGMHGSYHQEPPSYAQAPPDHDMFGRGRPGQDQGRGSYDQDPPRGQAPGRDYVPSNVGSIAESRMGALGSKMLVIDGKEYSVWTQQQLSAMNRDSLKKRCMDFRDLIGKDQLQPMPRHPDAMVDWLLHAQAMVVSDVGNVDDLAGYGRGLPRGMAPDGGMARGGPPGGMSGGGPTGGMARGGSRDYEPSEAPSEAQSNYQTNMRQAQAIREKNQGSRGLW